MSTAPFGEGRIPRRSVLKGIGTAALASTVLGGTAAGKPGFPWNNKNAETVFGEGAEIVGDPAHDDVWTFATTNKAGKPTMVGVWLTKAGYDAVTATPAPTHFHLDLPSFPGSNFTFAGVDWNPQGHPPAPLWTVPHFDFHFYLMDEADVEAIPFGVPTYELPAEQTPTGYVTEAELGAPDRTVIPAMGEHLVDADANAPPHTYIYGAYDPAINESDPGVFLGEVELAPGVVVPLYRLTSGDGVGELTFVEPMVTAAYLDSLVATDGEVHVPIPTPEVFPAAGYYPTAYGIRYVGKEDAFLVTLEDFEWFDASQPAA